MSNKKKYIGEVEEAKADNSAGFKGHGYRIFSSVFC